MSNANEPAFPVADTYVVDNYFTNGLTKRELFAAMAMQGLLSNVARRTPSHEWPDMAPTAVRLADDLLAELDKRP